MSCATKTAWSEGLVCHRPIKDPYNSPDRPFQNIIPIPNLFRIPVPVGSQPSDNQDRQIASEGNLPQEEKDENT